jgi:hypothetical protein
MPCSLLVLDTFAIRIKCNGLPERFGLQKREETYGGIVNLDMTIF